ncbi:MAG: metal-transporting ATPase, partial [candidate division KSB1 bacterium]|nr:metal-transporting ATPase [candidate division KSB1 bacterium]
MKEGEAQRIVLPVAGMHCASCVHQVTSALRKVPGVREVRVNLATEQASVLLARDQTGIPDLIQAVREAGYDVPLEKLSARVEGMTPAGNAEEVVEALRDMPGVMEVEVDPIAGTLSLGFVQGLVTPDQVARKLAEAGYRWVVAEERGTHAAEARDEEEERVHAVRRRLVLAWGFTVPVALLMLAEMAGLRWVHKPLVRLVGMALAVPVIFVAGREVLRRGAIAARHLRATMDTLISLGSLVAFATGPLSLGLPV